MKNLRQRCYGSECIPVGYAEHLGDQFEALSAPPPTADIHGADCHVC
jgi:hypothetical protein